MDPAPVSAAAVASSRPREAPEAAPPALIAPGGSYIKGGISDPIEREAWLRGKVEASVFARWLQDIEDGCLGCVRRVLQAEGWPARSWQQDGLLVEDEGGRRLRGGGRGLQLDESPVN